MGILTKKTNVIKKNLKKYLKFFLEKIFEATFQHLKKVKCSKGLRNEETEWKDSLGDLSDIALTDDLNKITIEEDRHSLIEDKKEDTRVK